MVSLEHSSYWDGQDIEVDGITPSLSALILIYVASTQQMVLTPVSERFFNLCPFKITVLSLRTMRGCCPHQYLAHFYRYCVPNLPPSVLKFAFQYAPFCVLNHSTLLARFYSLQCMGHFMGEEMILFRFLNG